MIRTGESGRHVKMRPGIRFLTLLLCFLGSLPAAAGPAPTPEAPVLAPEGLLTNQTDHPLNVEEIVFSWTIPCTGNREIQQDYEVVVTDPLRDRIVWKSERIRSSQQSGVAYAGPELVSMHPYTWKVRIWDQRGLKSVYSDEAAFTTGILSEKDWVSKWIGDGRSGSDKKALSFNHFWYARSRISLNPKRKAVYACVCVSAFQDYELYVNGEEIGRAQNFNYQSEPVYQAFDITKAVQKDREALGIGMLIHTFGPGQGRAASNCAIRPVIKIYWDNTEVSCFGTEQLWHVKGAGHIAALHERAGGEGDFTEIFDAREELENYSMPDYEELGWQPSQPASVEGEPYGLPVPDLVGIEEHEIRPVRVSVLEDGTTVADFGEVIPARPLICFQDGSDGRVIRIETGYALAPDGHIDVSADQCQQTDMSYTYIQREGEQTYRAWDYLGFRYLSVPACGEDMSLEGRIRALAVHAPVPKGFESELETSDEMLNEVFDLMKRSALRSVTNCFVDTPTREKGQFLLDTIKISTSTMALWHERVSTRRAILDFLASADRFFTDEEAGRYNCVYPNGDGKRDIPDYTVSFPAWVWEYYMQTADEPLLKECFPYMLATAEYIRSCISERTGLVERLPGGSDIFEHGVVDFPESMRFGYDREGTKDGAIATINMQCAHALAVTVEAARALGNGEAARQLLPVKDQLTQSINEQLLTADGVYCDGLDREGMPSDHCAQHSTAYALYYDLVPEEVREKAAAYVAGLGMQQGPMTADVLLGALTAGGQDEAAYRLLTDPDEYGWARIVALGGTFTWESWTADTDGYSQSHGWGAGAGACMLSWLSGVRVTEPGAARVRIAPPWIGLDSLKSRVSTQRGFVEVSYQKEEDGSFRLTIVVPVNVTADVTLPGGEDLKWKVKGTKEIEGADLSVPLELPGGTYHFET